MRDLDCDVAVIGAGTAGLAVHRAATAAGARALLIERGAGRNDLCPGRLMPSKMLIAAAAAANAARRADQFGIRVSGISVDGPAVLERVRFVASAFEGLDALPEEARIGGSARSVDGRTLVNGDRARIRFRAPRPRYRVEPGRPEAATGAWRPPPDHRHPVRNPRFAGTARHPLGRRRWDRDRPGKGAALCPRQGDRFRSRHSPHREVESRRNTDLGRPQGTLARGRNARPHRGVPCAFLDLCSCRGRHRAEPVPKSG